MHLHFLTPLISLLLVPAAYAQSNGLSASYSIASEVAVGRGEYTAYQLVSNQHDVLSTRANTGYLRAALELEKPLTSDFRLSGAVDIVASFHTSQSFYLQQLYANLAWKVFYVEVGTREHQPVIRDALLSSGSLISSGNAKPLPELRFGTEDFWTIPRTKDWLQMYFDVSYGHFLDGNWLEDRFDTYYAAHHNSYVTTDVWYHQKKLFFRTDPSRRFSFTIGMEHAVQFGGHCIDYSTGKRKEIDISPDFGDFFQVILPLGDGNVGNTYDKTKEWVKGNHLGSWNLILAYNIDAQKQLTAYVESLFEDGSGIRKGNGWDGLWGLEYQNKSTHPQWLRGIVLEYLQTTDQSGPIHWAPEDFSGMVDGKLPESVTGNDNYYNNYMYNGYCHYGMSLGTPMLMSPVYNKDFFGGFVDNRVKAWHLGVRGEMNQQWSYLVRGSYREGWGTFFVPLNPRLHSFDMMVQTTYQCGNFKLSAAYGNDTGNIYGDCNTFNFKVVYHGKIL